MPHIHYAIQTHSFIFLARSSAWLQQGELIFMPLLLLLLLSVFSFTEMGF
jgi:hypothetical protein